MRDPPGRFHPYLRSVAHATYARGKRKKHKDERAHNFFENIFYEVGHFRAEALLQFWVSGCRPILATVLLRLIAAPSSKGVMADMVLVESVGEDETIRSIQTIQTIQTIHNTHNGCTVRVHVNDVHPRAQRPYLNPNPKSEST